MNMGVCSNPTSDKVAFYCLWEKIITFAVGFLWNFVFLIKRFWKVHVIFTISVKVFIEKLELFWVFPYIFVDLWTSGWPSGLRRQNQGPYVFVMGVLVHECGRGFESHFWQNSILLSLRKNNYVWCWFSVKFWLYIKKILKSSLDIYNLCESIYWTIWSYSVFFINICSSDVCQDGRAV